MLSPIFICSFIVFAIWYSTREDEIFGIVQKWTRLWPDKIKKPLFDCGVCSGFWHSLYLYPLLFNGWDHFDLWNIFVPISVVGLNAVITKLWPEKVYMDDDY